MHDPEIDRHSRPRGIAVTCYLLLAIAIGCGKQRTDAPRIDDVSTADVLPEQTIPAPVETKPRAGAASGAAKGTLQPASTTRRVRLRTRTCVRDMTPMRWRGSALEPMNPDVSGYTQILNPKWLKRCRRSWMPLTQLGKPASVHCHQTMLAATSR